VARAAATVAAAATEATGAGIRQLAAGEAIMAAAPMGVRDSASPLTRHQDKKFHFINSVIRLQKSHTFSVFTFKCKVIAQIINKGNFATLANILVNAMEKNIF
jgi:hypothetical protein